MAKANHVRTHAPHVFFALLAIRLPPIRLIEVQRMFVSNENPQESLRKNPIPELLSSFREEQSSEPEPPRLRIYIEGVNFASVGGITISGWS